MTLKAKAEGGFTAVELLITLIIASMFLFAGYQLYTQVTRDGNEANRLAKVSNTAYELLRERGATVSAANPNGCGFVGESSNNTVIDNITYTVSHSCPQGSTAQADVFLIKVSAYLPNTSGTSGPGPLIAEHATYVN
jgi:prepilin-type N-terminal cleavage/methylation domain-containing protein